MENCVERDSKVNVEETIVNLNCVKSEPYINAIDFDENVHVLRYTVSLDYGSVFGELSYNRNLEEYEDNLIGFLNDDDVIMENVVIKLEGVKKEDVNSGHFRCSKCNGKYEGYCVKCSSLSHILNNAVSLVKSETELNTAPTNILEIRDTSVGKGVFILKTLPKDIIFGPFEGVLAMENTERYSWKVSDKKLVNIKNGNWMKNVCATNASFKNLNIIQIKGNLYFQTNREIMVGEELLLYYDDEEIQQLDNSEECYFIPQKQENVLKVFACTLCCLGFRFVRCLMEHKSKCPYREPTGSIKDCELVECHSCNVWLEKQEHQEYHMAYCLEKYHRLRHDLPNFQQTHTYEASELNKTDGLATPNGIDASNSTPIEIVDSDNCCKLDKKKYFHADIMKATHTNTSQKTYKCPDCFYRTIYKYCLKRHVNTHYNIKPFECDICQNRFSQKVSLEIHIRNKHTNTSEKEYKCYQCTYQTNLKGSLKSHLNTHNDIKPFECKICKKRFRHKKGLEMHLRYIHLSEKDIKLFECEICKKKLRHKSSLKTHTKHIHFDRIENDIMAFECGICKKKFYYKSSLRLHIKDKHSNTKEKDYRCSQCSYQTSYKTSFRKHLNTHNDIKPFECHICKKRFRQRNSVYRHIKDQHS